MNETTIKNWEKNKKSRKSMKRSKFKFYFKQSETASQISPLFQK